MVRGGKGRAGSKARSTSAGPAARGGRNTVPAVEDEDPLHDLRVQDDDWQDPVNDEYVWPQFDEETDD